MADEETTVEFDAPAFRSTLNRIYQNVRTALLPVLKAEAEQLQSAANAEVPVQSGELKASSFTDAALTKHGNPAATMGYLAPYAAAVHEGFHGGKQTKTPHQFWLQTAANRMIPDIRARVAAAVRKVVGG